MCFEAILISLSLVIFVPARSVLPEFSPSTNHAENPLVDSDHVVVTSTTTSSVTLKIKFKRSVKKLLTGTSVHYRPKVAVRAPPALEWSPRERYYVTREAHGLHDSGVVGNSRHPDPRRRATKHLSITINNLKFPGIEYEFEIENFFEDITARKVDTVARTRPVLPSPPKTGTGCFSVYRVDVETRTVKVFWQPVFDDLQYEVSVYEDGEKPSLMYKGTGALSSGFMWLNISFKAHRFIFKSVNEAGHSRTSSIVEVPAQQDILFALLTDVHLSRQNKTYLLTWKASNNEDVSSYTVFWLDTVYGGMPVRIRDFVFVSSDENSFEVEENGWVGLGMSVNTYTASSGLHTVHYGG